MMIDSEGKSSFAFIHGDWSLDNSRGTQFCGVTMELDILKRNGCYADFTFPAFGQKSQPRMINSIYYVTDNELSKSYDTGILSKVGKKNKKDLLIFQGPLMLGSYGAIESDPYPGVNDIDSWVAANIHVAGRPDWIFIKTFTHGAQSKDVFFSTVVENMFSYLEKKFSTGDFRLHYVTAREAYNLVMAAEDGKNGDPHRYLDYEIKQPLCSRETRFSRVLTEERE